MGEKHLTYCNCLDELVCLTGATEKCRSHKKLAAVMVTIYPFRHQMMTVETLLSVTVGSKVLGSLTVAFGIAGSVMA